MSQTTPPPGPGATGAPSPDAPPRLLRRSTGDRWLGGVGSGFARYFAVDPVLVRVGLVALAVIALPAAVILYVACLVLIPADNSPAPATPRFVDRNGKTLAIIAGVLLVIACLGSVGGGWDRHNGWGIVVPLLVVLGIFGLFRWRRGTPAWQSSAYDPAYTYNYNYSYSYGPGVANAGAAQAAPAAPAAPYPGAPEFTSAQAAPAAPAAASAPTAPYVSTPYPAAAYATATYPTTGPPVPPSAGYAQYGQYTWKPRERSALGPLTVGAALVTAGTLIALDRGDVVSVPTVVVFASALAVVGLGLVVGAVFGRARGLIALGVVLSIVTAIAGVVNLPSTNSTGDQVWRPVTAAEASQTFKWGAGDAELDLTAVRTTTPGTPITTSVELGIGEVIIRVPRDAIVNVHAKVGLGGITTGSTAGPDINDTNDRSGGDTVGGISREVTTSLQPADVTPRTTVINLDASVGVGHVEVTRA